MINAGLLLLPTLLQLSGLSVLINWFYLRTSGNILLTSLFHAAQSFFVIVNEGIPLTQLGWVMAGVYLALALIVVIVAESSFARKPVAAILQVDEATRTGQPIAIK